MTPNDYPHPCPQCGTLLPALRGLHGAYGYEENTPTGYLCRPCNLYRPIIARHVTGHPSRFGAWEKAPPPPAAEEDQARIPEMRNS